MKRGDGRGAHDGDGGGGHDGGDGNGSNDGGDDDGGVGDGGGRFCGKTDGFITGKKFPVMKCRVFVHPI